ncbi:hypothetical protein [Arcobacter porcinus]|nr:hypothetical protein [Arcobacter porcinus]
MSVKIIVTDNLKQELKEFSIKNRISLISLTAEICEDLFIELLKTEK